MLRLLGSILIILFYSAATAGEDLVWVKSMHYPAWLVRDFQTQALSPGAKLRANDLVRTGEGSRVLIEMADGSAIKLGESARFIIESASLAEENGESILDSSFQILRGAFRYTSAFFGTSLTVPRTEFRIGALTAGVRGTDIWGRSQDQRDLLCLLEGAISARAGEGERLLLDQRYSVLTKPRDAAMQPPQAVESQQVAAWAAETELVPERGIAARDGVWQLVLYSLTRREQADRLVAQMREQGFAVQRKSVIRQGRTLHRLLLPGFISVEAALAARGQVESKLGIGDAWVWRTPD